MTTMNMQRQRQQGTVKWFSRAKGYGFIAPDGAPPGADEDLFVHYSAIEGAGYRNLVDGQRVEYTVENSAKGLQAVSVVGLT